MMPGVPMSEPDRPSGQDGWQHRAADSDATQVVSSEDMRAASTHDAPLPARPATTSDPAPTPPADARASNDPAPGYEPYSTSEPYDSGAQGTPAAATEPSTAASTDASSAANWSDSSGGSSTRYPYTSDDPDATSVYRAPGDPSATAAESSSGQGSPAGAAPAGYSTGYGAPRYGDPEAPRPYETPSYAPTSGPTPTNYSYQQPYGYAGQPGPADQTSVLAPARNRVVIPKLRSRASSNTIAALIGLLLTFGGLALLVLVPLPNTSLNLVTNKILVILVVVIMMVPVLLLAWGAAATLVPGVLFTAASLWLLIGGAEAIVQTKRGLGSGAWVDRTIGFFASIQGLAVGLALLFASIAAWMIRRYTRREIQDALDAEYAAEQMRPVQRP